MFIGQRGRESAFGWAASLVSAGILGLSMTPASLGEGPPDPPCDEPEPVVLYNADCGDLPENATPPWSTNSCGLTVGQFGTIVGDPGNLFPANR